MMLKDFEERGERQHTLSIIKSRGMKHSSSVCKYLLTDSGFTIADTQPGSRGGGADRGTR
jgi:hypothetical protein